MSQFDHARDRLPPHSVEAEAGVLACCLQDPPVCIGECMERFLAPDVFYDLRHVEIYRAMVEMTDKRLPVDVISLCQWLKDRGGLEAVVGMEYLSDLAGQSPSASNLSYYVGILAEKATLRKLIRTCTEIVSSAWESEGKVGALLDQAETSILAVRGRHGAEMKEPKEVVHEVINEIEAIHANAGKLTGLPSGLPDLDAITWGFQPEMYVIAGYTSTGKTTLAMQFAAHCAIEAGIPAGVFSLEMDAKTLMMRTVLSRAGVDLYDLRFGRMTERDFPKLTGAAGKIARSNNLWIDDSPTLTIGQMKAKARRMVAQRGVRLLVVDQVSLVEGGDEETRQMQIDRINLACQQISRELKIPVFAIAQLNDDGELRESRAGGQHGGGVLKIVLKQPIAETIGESMIEVDLVVTKLRNGRTGKVCLLFDKPHTRFLPCAKVSQEDIPNYDND